MEKLALYNDNNKPLDKFVNRKDKLSIPDGTYFKIVLIFIQNNENKFLIQKVSKEKGGVYATTGGHVTYNDSSIKTAIKEVKEELNITITEEDLILFSIIKHQKAFADCYYIKKEININDIKLQEEEVEEVFYLTKNEIELLIKEGNFRKSNLKPYYILNELIQKNKLKKDMIAEQINID